MENKGAAKVLFFEIDTAYVVDRKGIEGLGERAESYKGEGGGGGGDRN